MATLQMKKVVDWIFGVGDIGMHYIGTYTTAPAEPCKRVKEITISTIPGFGTTALISRASTSSKDFEAIYGNALYADGLESHKSEALR